MYQKNHKNVWLIDANMETNPIFNLNDEAVLANNKDLAKSLFGAISDDFDTYLQNTNMLKCNLMNFIWKSYQNGEKLDFDTMNAFKTADKFIEFVEDNFKANPITRNYNIKKREEFLHDIKHNFRNDLIFLFSMFGYVSSFKLFIMSRLQSATPVKTNINGSPCLHEGFVVSKTKLVDRETFCKVNYDNNTKRKAAQNGR